MEIGICEICEREGVPITKHHLIPKSKHGSETIDVCRPCGKQIHALFTLSELKNRYNTLQKLKREPRMVKFIDWIRKRRKIDIKVRRSW
jgi:RNase P subunit RPR2